MNRNSSTLALVKSETTAPSPARNTAPLTDEDYNLLQTLQTTIKDNLLSSAKVSVAFATIRDKKLYREDYKTFEQYCALRWSYSVSYCHRLAKMGKVLNDLKPFEGQDVYPTTESHARVFANLKSADRIKLAETVMKESEDDLITAEVLERYKMRLFPDKCAKPKSSSTKPTSLTSQDTGAYTTPPTPMKCLTAAKKLLATLQNSNYDDDALVDDLQSFIKEAGVCVLLEKQAAKHKK